ncbi:MAG: hypothetical protein WCL51_17195 [Bacteroidota bacterium]
MKRYIYLIIGAFICIISCKKEVSLPDENNSIIIGKTSGLLTKTYDAVLIGEYNGLKSFDLDVNGDNIPDFRFTSEIWGSPGLGQHPQSRLLCLNNNSLIFGYLNTDTTYLDFQSDTSYGQNMTPVYIYNTTIYSCMKISDADSIVKIAPNQFRLKAKTKGESINKAAFNKSDTVILSDEWYSQYVSPITQNDTLIYNYVDYHSTCNSFPQDKILYVGIKVKTSNVEKIGWIKISISDNYKISILESAIQK